jgi:hypothetical protein
VMTMASHKNSHVLSQREIKRDDLLSNGQGGRSDNNSEGIGLGLGLSVTSTPTAVASSISVIRGKCGSQPWTPAQCGHHGFARFSDGAVGDQDMTITVSCHGIWNQSPPKQR